MNQNNNFSAQAEVHNNYGVRLFKENKYAEARQQYEKAIQLKPDYLQAYFNLGLLFVAETQLERAIVQFNHALALNPQSVEAHWQLAFIYWQCNDLEKVQLHYQKLFELTPRSTELLNNMGALALKKNQLEVAIDYFKQALEIDPKHKEARNNLAVSLLEKNDFNEAIWHYSLYLNLEPNDKIALYNRAQALMLTGQLSKAIEDLKKILVLDTNHIEAYCNLAAIYLKLEDRNTALINYQEVLNRQKAHPIASYMQSALTQQAIPTTPPIEYIKNLFDNYAFQFDIHLKEVLHYKTPELLKQQVIPYLKHKNYNVLDLGCGTGLSGVPFSEIAKKLTGIDVSSKMLAQAKSKNCYDELIEKDILTGLSELNEAYDLILAIDTLVYFGELDTLFSKISSHMQENGLFAFSIELSNKPGIDYKLQTTGRYQHTNEYIKKLAKKNKLKCLKSLSVDGRYQNNKFVKNGLFLLTKKM